MVMRGVLLMWVGDYETVTHDKAMQIHVKVTEIFIQNTVSL